MPDATIAIDVPSATKSATKRTGSCGSHLKGGTVFDVFLTTTAAAVGQSILALPTTLSWMGAEWGILWELLFHTASTYTGYLLLVLYLDFKAQFPASVKPNANAKADTLSDQTQSVCTSGIVQYHDIMGFHVAPWFGVVSRVFVIITLFGLATVQFIAASSNLYLLSDQLNKQQWTFVFAAPTLGILLLPGLEHFRVLTLLGLLTTTYTALYMVSAAALHGPVDAVDRSGPQSMRSFFTGSADIIFTFSGHGMLTEVMHTMEHPERFGIAFSYQWVYVSLFLTIPNSLVVWWTFGTETLLHHNALALLPRSEYRDVAVVLMALHSLVAFGLFVFPLFIMAEKACCVHRRPLHWRLLPRLLVFGLCLLVGLAFPFFGPANGVIGAVLSSNVTYILPCVAHLWVYRTAERRRACVLQPWWPQVTWTLIAVINILIATVTAIAGFALGSYYTMLTLIDDAASFGIFARCYQCPQIAVSALFNATSAA